MTKDKKIITREEVSQANELLLNEKQLNFILGSTPRKYIKTRPGKGGGTWEYVSTSYIQKVLNLMFGWDWDFNIESENIMKTQVVVKGKLIVRMGDKTITKSQYGRKDVVYKRDTNEPLDIGNDLKAAASDCLKKCATMLGIAADVYGDEDFIPTKIVSKEEIAKQKEEARKEKFKQVKKEAQDGKI
jgi:hypothetical protein